jgi:predicted TPR repeat methyltransferase
VDRLVGRVGDMDTLAGVSVSRLHWDHNAYYQQVLLRQLPQRCERVLDVGCGAGAFAARLDDHVEHVDAVDKSATMIEAAHTGQRHLHPHRRNEAVLARRTLRRDRVDHRIASFAA